MIKLIILLSIVTASPAFADDVALPSFQHYHVEQATSVKPAPVDINSHPRATEFRTMLRNGASKGPNFAGHYTIATWGCGVACQEIAVIDAEAGQVFFPENLKLVAYHMVTDQSSPIEFRLDSRLLIIRGAPNDGDETGIFYYEWDGRRLTLLKSVPKVWPK